jgi:hypothetical protein
MMTVTMRAPFLAGTVVVAGLAMARPARAQTPVDAMTAATTTLQRAEALLAAGHRDSATELLGRHLAEDRVDGRAWLFLGQIYLAEAQRWHRTGHPDSIAAGTMLDFASTSFEPAQELLTDSGGVFRVLVAVERATLQIERGGWPSLADWSVPPEEVPLPPVLAELGHNLLTSCPRNGVLLTGSLAETAAVWGVRLLGTRGDVILVRPDLYRVDARYRARMATAIGADSSSDLSAAIAEAARARAVCLAPSVDRIAVPDVTWHPIRMVLASTAPDNAIVAPLSVFHFGRTGLVGSVWTSAARDIYDLAARRNPALCHGLFTNTDTTALPTIPACTP